MYIAFYLNHPCTTTSAYPSRSALPDHPSSRVIPAPVLSDFDFAFAENGLVAYEAGELIAVQSIAKHLGEDNLQKLINFMLKYLAGGLERLRLGCLRGCGL